MLALKENDWVGNKPSDVHLGSRIYNQEDFHYRIIPWQTQQEFDLPPASVASLPDMIKMEPAIGFLAGSLATLLYRKWE